MEQQKGGAMYICLYLQLPAQWTGHRWCLSLSTVNRQDFRWTLRHNAAASLLHAPASSMAPSACPFRAPVVSAGLRDFASDSRRTHRLIRAGGQPPTRSLRYHRTS